MYNSVTELQAGIKDAYIAYPWNLLLKNHLIELGKISDIQLILTLIA